MNECLKYKVKIISNSDVGCFHTIAIAKANSLWEEAGILRTFEKLGSNYQNRYVEVHHPKFGFTVLGVHIPIYDEKNGASVSDFWDCIKAKFINTGSFITVGDCNVFDIGTVQKKKYYELLSEQVIDMWLEKGKSHIYPTANTGKRIDYAFVTESVFEKAEIDVDDDVRKNGISDHSAIVINIIE